jgi:hypothetical protein
MLRSKIAPEKALLKRRYVTFLLELKQALAQKVRTKLSQALYLERVLIKENLLEY